MSGPDPAPVRVDAWDLRRSLGAVLPHAATDGTLPALMAVRFEVRDGWLFLVATDRFSIAVTRQRVIEGDQGLSATLPVDGAKALRRILKRTAGGVALSLTADVLRAETDDRRTAGWVTSRGKFPAWRTMLGKLLAAPAADLDGKHGVNPQMLARFGTEDGAVRVRIVREANEHSGPAVLVTRGGWFFGVLMSARVPALNDFDGASVWDAWSAALGSPQPDEAAQ